MDSHLVAVNCSCCASLSSGISPAWNNECEWCQNSLSECVLSQILNACDI